MTMTRKILLAILALVAILSISTMFGYRPPITDGVAMLIAGVMFGMLIIVPTVAMLVADGSIETTVNHRHDHYLHHHPTLGGQVRTDLTLIDAEWRTVE